MVFCIQCLTPGILVYREGRISSLHCPLVLSTPLSSQTPDSVMHIKALPSSLYNTIFIHIKALPSSPYNTIFIHIKNFLDLPTIQYLYTSRTSLISLQYNIFTHQ